MLPKLASTPVSYRAWSNSGLSDDFVSPFTELQNLPLSRNAALAGMMFDIPSVVLSFIVS